MRTFIFISCFLAIFIFVSCGGEMGVKRDEKSGAIASRVITMQGDTVLSCNVADVKDTIELPLSSVVDSLEIIRLDNQSGQAENIGTVIMSDNYIGIKLALWRAGYNLYTRKGEYVCTLNFTDAGKKDRLNIYDVQIDEEHERIYFLPWPDKQVWAYDLKGNYLGTIPLAYRLNKGGLHVDTDEQQVAIVQMPFNGENAPIAWTQDFDGNLIHQKQDSVWDVWPDYSNEVTVSVHEQDFMAFSIFGPGIANDMVTDTLYHYYFKKNVLNPKVVISTVGTEVCGANMAEYPRFYTAKLFKMGAAYYTFMGKLMIDKRTLQCHYYNIKNDLLSGIPIEGDFYETGFIANMKAADLKAAIAKRLREGEIDLKLTAKDRIFLQNLGNEIVENDNNYIVFGKYKK